MNVAGSWAIDIIGPAVLLIGLIWLVIRAPSHLGTHDKEQSENAARALNHDEDQRRQIRVDQR